ncbi:hypothetical protein GCM10023220_40080 [Streptomyces ziwulingensis]|uniref:Roadblock/LAMTOR2 domain-containing protein n=1 Tax=Streptomyces ziwulingensis TaxID=1045501 RepID=A0ABP9CAC8_9ACTN
MSLADAVTGLSYGAAGAQRLDADDCGRLAVLIDERLHAAGAEGELETVVVTGARHQLVMHLLPGYGDPLLLTVALERERANLALVLRHLSRYPAQEAA